MIVTILASVFILTILVIAVFGFKAIIRQGKPPADINKERCSICREPFLKSELIERQIGDYRLYYFCSSCINALHRELISKN
jgi:hypothetical protein